jgi:hypothetical protein
MGQLSGRASAQAEAPNRGRHQILRRQPQAAGGILGMENGCNNFSVAAS